MLAGSIIDHAISIIMTQLFFGFRLKRLTGRIEVLAIVCVLSAGQMGEFAKVDVVHLEDRHSDVHPAFFTLSNRYMGFSTSSLT